MTRADQDRIDDAIDQVAARMTRVDEDAELAARIVASLPERSMWSFGWLMPRLAITGVLGLATAMVVLRMFDGRSTNVLRTDVPSSPTVARSTIAERPSNDRATVVEPPPIVRRTPVEPPSNDRPQDRPSDFEGSLPALEAASMLTLESLAPVTLAEDAQLTLVPLAIADLPLTAETVSPRIEEQ